MHTFCTLYTSLEVCRGQSRRMSSIKNPPFEIVDISENAQVRERAQSQIIQVEEMQSE